VLRLVDGQVWRSRRCEAEDLKSKTTEPHPTNAVGRNSRLSSRALVRTLPVETGKEVEASARKVVAIVGTRQGRCRRYRSRNSCPYGRVLPRTRRTPVCKD
jgi:hypothetical protein